MADLKQKIFDLVKKPTVSAMATVTPEGLPWVRYVMVTADPNLVLRTATFKNSRKLQHLAKCPEVHITVGGSGPDGMGSYLQIQARAIVADDAKERHAFWNDGLRAYFQGPDDPNYCVMISTPYRIEFMGESMQPEVWVP